MLIVTNIKDMNIGFHVDEVRGIHKTTVANITEPGEYLSTSVREAIAGVLNIDGKTLEILDLRKIISNVNPDIEL
jgi:two-component system chemotaxis response regulator CheV